jgi:2-dehydro-3-deoxy-D-arabinonate dehydratase
MKLCRFKDKKGEIRIGMVTEDSALVDLTPVGIHEMGAVLESDAPLACLKQTGWQKLPRIALSEVVLCAPVERQEVWAAGVTYLRSKTARMEESNFSALAYDRVYEAARPELFFKSLGEKVAASGEPVGIRRDARWSVPEPELALLMNSRGEIVGCTIGNDMSSRDIEGENLLYLPQAKIYEGSCALGPWLVLGASEAVARAWRIHLGIMRGGLTVFAGETMVDRLKRNFNELAAFLFRSQKFPHGAVLLTGTGIIPPDNFTLQAGDQVEIRIDGIGSLRNTVTLV